jgi:hypothetical protein
MAQLFDGGKKHPCRGGEFDCLLSYRHLRTFKNVPDFRRKGYQGNAFP